LSVWRRPEGGRRSAVVLPFSDPPLRETDPLL